MVHLGVLGAIVPAASQNENAPGTGSSWIIFEMCHHSNEWIFALGFLMSIYVEISTEQRAYICWHRVNNTFSHFKFVCLPQYNNVLKSLHHKVDTMPKSLLGGGGDIASCISLFVFPSKPIRDNYTNRPKTHNI